MSDVTQILHQIESGNPSAAEDLLPLVYDELRKLAAARMARESSDQTLQPTALVHEAYVRLVDTEQAQHWNSRGHFFGAAAEAMRRILLDRVRNKQRLKRGGRRNRLDLDRLQLTVDCPDGVLLDINEALEELASEDPPSAELVKLRYFAGLSHTEAAKVLGISRRVADRLWVFARAWLYDALTRDESSSTAGD